MKKMAGFTLLEVIIAIAIFAVLSAYVAQAIQNGIKSKNRVQTQIDSVSRMRDALRLMEKDLNLAYHYLDWEKELQGIVKQGLQNNPQQQQQQQASSEVQRLDPTTHFVGDDKSIHFVTMNNARFQDDRKMADFVEVGYELKSCQSVDGKSSSQCLWRRQSGPVDIDVTKGGDQMVLLENVTELKFRFLGEAKTDWLNAWDSTGKTQQDESMKNSYPLAVEVSLTTQKPDKGKKYSMQIVANIHFPNNRKPTQNTGQPSGNPNPNSGVGP